MDTIKPQVYYKFNPQLLLHFLLGVENAQMAELGKKIKAALESKGMTQTQLAEVCEVSNNAVTKWIRTGKVAKGNIPKIIKALGLSVADFLETEDDEQLTYLLRLLENPKRRALLMVSEQMADYQLDFLIQKSAEITEKPTPEKK